MTVHAHVAAARERLRTVGIANGEAGLDARLLAQHALGWDRARLLAEGHNAEPPVDFAAVYERLVARRTAREPIAYIIGEQEFRGLSFEVSPAVLIPRPETELLVDALLDLFGRSGRPLRVADVCTGSGCVAIAVASERPQTRIVATDVSEDALALTRRNALRHQVADRIELVRTDLLNGLRDAFDAIVANPPYVPEKDRASLAPEVREHEPAVALFAADEGLAVIRRLVADSVDRLASGGVLICECGFGQADAVRELISDQPALKMMDFRRDLQGIERAAVASRVP